MPIAITCPSCSRAIKAPDAAAGKQGTCPACRAPFVIPMPTASITSKPAPRPVEDEEPVRRRKRRDEEYDDAGPRHRGGWACPECGSTLQPRSVKNISNVGVVLTLVSGFACLLLGFCLLIPWLFLPLCPLFLLITEQGRRCRECGRNVD